WYQPRHARAAWPNSPYAACIVVAIGRINHSNGSFGFDCSIFLLQCVSFCAGEAFERPAQLYRRSGPCVNLSMPIAVNEVRSRGFCGFVSVSTKFDAHVLSSQAPRA
ncbi:hypothetical protein, partial [Trinickia sp.]|uniref:hypothetical protein n=1 Tax=Trinickia sp. TaxID=2571163 RepID=UPI003F7EED09